MWHELQHLLIILTIFSSHLHSSLKSIVWLMSLGSYQFPTPRARRDISHACEKKYFLSLWWGMPNSMVGNRIFDTDAFSVTFWSGSQMSAPWEQGFFAHAKKNISRHCVGECPNSMVGNRICDTSAFSFAFWGDPKCRLPESRDFSCACEKNISWHWDGECPNSMVENRIYYTVAFSVAF